MKSFKLPHGPLWVKTFYEMILLLLWTSVTLGKAAYRISCSNGFLMVCSDGRQGANVNPLNGLISCLDTICLSLNMIIAYVKQHRVNEISIRLPSDTYDSHQVKHSPEALSSILKQVI